MDQGQRPDRRFQDGDYSAALQVDTEEFAAERGLVREGKMHYRNGREAHNGDIVLSLDGYGNAVINAIGVLHSATAGNDYCNGSIAPIQPTNKGACLIDCLHIEDVLALLAEMGLDKRPAGK